MGGLLWAAGFGACGPEPPDGAPPQAGSALTDAAALVHSGPVLGDLERGLVALQGGDPESAVRYLTDAIVADSTRPEAFDGLGSAYGMLGDAVGQLAAAERAVRLAPDVPAYLSNRAQAYRRFGRMDDAVRDLDRALEIDPTFVAARFNRGSLRFQGEDFDGALEDFTAAIEAEPTTAPAYFNRAVTHEALGDMDAAIADLERYLDVSESPQAEEVARPLLERWTGR